VFDTHSTTEDGMARTSTSSSCASLPLSMCSSQMEMSEMMMGEDGSAGGSMSRAFMSLMKDPKTSPSIGAHRLESVKSTEEGWKFKVTESGKLR
jgi:hypothetical protein